MPRCIPRSVSLLEKQPGKATSCVLCSLLLGPPFRQPCSGTDEEQQFNFLSCPLSPQLSPDTVECTWTQTLGNTEYLSIGVPGISITWDVQETVTSHYSPIGGYLIIKSSLLQNSEKSAQCSPTGRYTKPTHPRTQCYIFSSSSYSMLLEAT